MCKACKKGVKKGSQKGVKNGQNGTTFGPFWGPFLDPFLTGFGQNGSIFGMNLRDLGPPIWGTPQKRGPKKWSKMDPFLDPLKKGSKRGQKTGVAFWPYFRPISSLWL